MILGSLSNSLQRPLLCSLTPRMSPSLVPILSFAHYCQAPATQATSRDTQSERVSHTPPILVRHTFGRFTIHSAHDIEVPLPFPVLLLLYKLVGNVCWYSSCMAATVWASTDLQLFIHAKHPPLSRAEYSHLLLVSLTCNFLSLSVSQMQYAFCWVLARVPSPSSVVTLE